MKAYIVHAKLIVIALIAVFSSCERRALEDEFHETAKIPVKVFWDKAGITAQNATVLAYTPGGRLYLKKDVGGITNHNTTHETEIELEVGTYTIVVFNELINQIDNVRMRGHENLSTFEAYVTESSTRYSTNSRAGGETLVNQPSMLAVWKGEFTVTKEMVTHTRSRSKTKATNDETTTLEQSINALTDIHPLLKTVRANIKAHIKGIHNARMPALVELRNMAQGYMFGTNSNTTTPVTVQFMMNNRKYDPGSFTEGTISESLYTFGIMGNRTTVQGPIYLDFYFKLVDKEKTEVYRSFDITNLIQIEIDVNIAISINATININTPIPDVVPEGGSGMEAEVVDWEGERIGIEL